METTSDQLKTLVREKYGEIASSSSKGCGCGCSSANEVALVGEAYGTVEGYVPDADLGLGCGVPTELAGIKPGDTVLDLGSGAGLDVFAARAVVGETGRVIGVDMTPEMNDKARANAAALGFENVEFIQGDIEDLPIPSHSIDVIVSNCVLNLVPDTARAFAEIHRVLKPDGHFCVSDIVVDGVLPAAIQHAAELYVGCVSGAMERTRYLQTIEAAGFTEIEILKDREIEIPAEALEVHLSPAEIETFRHSGVSIRSVTVNGQK
jgi:SAM-dependent methyltransferase